MEFAFVSNVAFFRLEPGWFEYDPMIRSENSEVQKK